MASETEFEKLLTPAEVAAMFRVDAKTVTRWEKSGRIGSIRTLGGHRRYKEAEVRALLAATGRDRVTDPLDAPVLTLWPVSVSGPAASTARTLLGEGITTVRMLTAKTALGLRDLGFRPAQVDEIRLVLHRKGLALYGEVADVKAA